MKNTSGKKIAIGLDIGGSHVSGSLVDTTNYTIIQDSYKEIEIEEKESAEKILSCWSNLINNLKDKQQKINNEDVIGIGIAIPGPFDYGKGISLIQHKFKELYGLNIRKELASRTNILADNYFFINDAESFLKGKVANNNINNKNKKIESAIGITLGTGLGSAYYMDGKVKDANLWESPFRGKTAEDFISTIFCINRYKELTQKDIQGVKDLNENYKTDSYSQQVIHELGQNLSDFLKPIVEEKEFKYILLGGSICGAHDKFSKFLNTSFPPQKYKIFVEISTESMAMIGAVANLIENRE